MPYASGPTILSASVANGVSATARRTRVFLTTRKYTPEARAFARSCVMAATGRPRFSTMTMACAPATCLRDFRDYRLLLFQIETHSHPCFIEVHRPFMRATFAVSATLPRRAAPRLPVTASSRNILSEGTICAGFRDQMSGIRCQQTLRHAASSFKLSPQRSLTVRRGVAAAASLKIFELHRAGACAGDVPIVQAFADGCAKPAVSTRTPAPIVLETLTFCR